MKLYKDAAADRPIATKWQLVEFQWRAHEGCVAWKKEKNMIFRSESWWRTFAGKRR